MDPNHVVSLETNAFITLSGLICTCGEVLPMEKRRRSGPWNKRRGGGGGCIYRVTEVGNFLRPTASYTKGKQRRG